MKKSKKVCLILIGCYLVLLVAATFCSINYYQKHLTRVTLTVPKKGRLEQVVVYQEAVMEENGLARMTVKKSARIPQEALEKGRLLKATRLQEKTGEYQECRIVECIDSEEEECFYVTLEVSDAAEIAGAGERFQTGDVLSVEIDCSNLKEYSWVVPGRALHQNSRGDFCVYVVEPKEGAWGTEYVLKEEVVLCFPQYLGAGQAALFYKPDKPMVDWTSGYVYEGMKVWLLAEEPE